MWIWLDKNGTVKQYLTHGPSPVVGETDFQIFAYFDGLDTDFFDSATIKFRKPDRQGSVYPVLFMRKADMPYHYMSGDGTMSFFNENKSPYAGFLFDFSDFTEADEIVRLLDTPGLWEATITLLGAPNKTNVSGLITFEVGRSASDNEDQTELSLDQILENLILNAQMVKKNSTFYLKVCENFEYKAEQGELDAPTFTIGSVVLDKTTNNFYRILTVTSSVEDNTKVYATYEREIEYLKIVPVEDDITLEEIHSIDGGNTVLLRCNGKYYLSYVSESNEGNASFEIRNLTNGKRYHSNSIVDSTTLAIAVSSAYYVPGTYYTPHVSETGDLSWSNNNDEPNPETVNIRGPQGIQGEIGPRGYDALGAIYFTVNSDDGHLIMHYSNIEVNDDIVLVNDNPSSPNYYETLGVSSALIGHLVYIYD